MLRVQDVIDKYDPDILTFDDGVTWSYDAGGPFAPDLGVWLGIPDLAPHILAYYYNRNMARRGGMLEGVVNLKEAPEPVWGAVTRDFEMNRAGSLQIEPWQTEACIGNWHYDRALLDENRYRPASLMIPLFVDIVSKNGNLLLSIPLPGHGEPDADSIAFLEEFAAWNEINGEAIKGTRPWTRYGEGPSTEAEEIGAYQLSRLQFGAQDIRFTTKGDTLYAIVLGWPDDGRVLIRSLAEGSSDYAREIASVTLLGSSAALQWTRDQRGLAISVPSAPPSRHAFAFKILPA
jgi:alpha-L-fucosidase